MDSWWGKRSRTKFRKALRGERWVREVGAGNVLLRKRITEPHSTSAMIQKLFVPLKHWRNIPAI